MATVGLMWPAAWPKAQSTVESTTLEASTVRQAWRNQNPTKSSLAQTKRAIAVQIQEKGHGERLAKAELSRGRDVATRLPDHDDVDVDDHQVRTHLMPP